MRHPALSDDTLPDAQAEQRRLEEMHLLLHDLRGPLFTILSLTDLHQSQLNEMASPLGLDYYEIVRGCCEKTIGLVNNLLQVHRTNNTTEFSDTDLAALVRHHVAFALPTALQRGITLTCHCPEPHALARVNEDKVGRMVDNLLSNALKYTPRGGTVTVELRYADPTRELMQLLVTDSGVGIAESVLPHLFDKFTIASRTGLRGEASTGLGLYGVKQTAEQHDGTVRVFSQEGQGTRFVVELPTRYAA